MYSFKSMELNKPTFNPGIRTDVSLVDIGIKENRILTVTFRDENGAVNTTRFFEPLIDWFKTEKGYDEEGRKKKTSAIIKLIFELLRYPYKKPDGTLKEAEETVRKESKECESWEKFMHQVVDMWNMGIEQHRELYGTDKINVCGVWVYDNNGFVQLRKDQYRCNIMRSDCIDLPNKADFFKINHGYDRFEYPAKDIGPDDDGFQEEKTPF